MSTKDLESALYVITQTTSQKVNEVAQSKEPIKAALSQEIPISNSFIERSYKIKPLTLDDLRYYNR